MRKAVVVHAHFGKQVDCGRSERARRSRLTMGSSNARAGSALPAWKRCAEARIRRSGVSPPSRIARSTSSAAAAGAPRVRATSAAVSRACSVAGSELTVASARCLAFSSGSDSTSASARCILRRRAGPRRRRHRRASSGWLNRTRVPWMPMMPLSSTGSSSSTVRAAVVPVACASRSTVGSGAHAAASSTSRTSPSRLAYPVTHQFGQRGRQHWFGGR